jgi:hypothetical protein
MMNLSVFYGCLPFFLMPSVSLFGSRVTVLPPISAAAKHGCGAVRIHTNV